MVDVRLIPLRPGQIAPELIYGAQLIAKRAQSGWDERRQRDMYPAFLSAYGASFDEAKVLAVWGAP